MKRPKLVWVVGALLGLGCASAPDTPSLVAVPVFAQDEVPCQYEVIQRVRVRMPEGWRNVDELRRRLREAYGQAGARVGADAVIADLPDEGDGEGLLVRRRAGSLPPPVPTGPPGEAIRFIPGTCGG